MKNDCLRHQAKERRADKTHADMTRREQQHRTGEGADGVPAEGRKARPGRDAPHERRTEQTSERGTVTAGERRSFPDDKRDRFVREKGSSSSVIRPITTIQNTGSSDGRDWKEKQTNPQAQQKTDVRSPL